MVVGSIVVDADCVVVVESCSVAGRGMEVTRSRGVDTFLAGGVNPGRETKHDNAKHSDYDRCNVCMLQAVSHNTSSMPSESLVRFGQIGK